MASQIEQQVMRRLGSAEIRYTKGRRLLVQALLEADGPRSAGDLYRELKEEVPLSSIYRSLNTLSGLGILVPHHGPGGNNRFELSDWLMGHHHHLICKSCGTVDDIRLPGQTESIIEGLVGSATADKGFKASDHSFEIYGTCGVCLAEGRNEGL